MKTKEIRKSFLDFFAARGHTIVESSSLIPAGDPTLLFVNAGMVQFKDCFLGLEKRSYTRATSSQRCLRISGKHNDLENVGRTARHHTYFEMLGNFSFGDYFKRDAITYAWEFLTETLLLPKDRLWVTVFEKDEEATRLWEELTDVFPGRILACGEKDNFWAMGETGPCGPCSEIHYYLGEDLNLQSEADFRLEDGRYMEIWNLVFMQYNRDLQGKLTPLPKPSVDTGMGLERIAVVKQAKQANYDTDELRQLIAFTEDLSGYRYDGKDYRERDAEKDTQYARDIAFRVIADHTRATSFLIADGVTPSAEGRGYVLRRLIRRACRHGRGLGLQDAFLYKVAEQFAGIAGESYPELLKHSESIQKVLQEEEVRFLATLDNGLRVLDKELTELRQSESNTLSGEVAFMLHDTYGFPLDLTEDILRSKGIRVDRPGFEAAMEQQKSRSRSARSLEVNLLLTKNVTPVQTSFTGYERLEDESKVLALYTENGVVSSAKGGEDIAIVVSSTPFYGEQGGQIGDTGVISGPAGSCEVLDTQKVGGITTVHLCRVQEGVIAVGDNVRLEVDAPRREKIRVHHSATHLLHLALREVLGDGVRQAGSKVSDNSLRFDFTCNRALSDSQLLKVEEIVNQEILANAEISTSESSLEDAKQSGAMALFGEKYGDVVRVVKIGGRSRELCGGTHALRSGDLGVFNILSESSVSSGVRRIEAVSGGPAYREIAKKKRLIGHLKDLCKCGEDSLFERVERVIAKNKELEAKLVKSAASNKAINIKGLAEQARELPEGGKILCHVLECNSAKELREVADELRSQLGTSCIALGSVVDGKGIILIAVTKDLTKRFHAGKLMAEVAKAAGARGGGRADLAQAGGASPEKLTLAFDRFQQLTS